MGRIKNYPRKRRLIKKGKIRQPPIWASIRKFGLKRVRTRRIFVGKEKKWRSGSIKE